VVAEDNLSGKKLICLCDPSEVLNYGFWFFSEKKVEVIVTNKNSQIKYFDLDYFAMPSEINIVSNIPLSFHINRKTLELIKKESDEEEIMGTCELVEQSQSLRTLLKNIMFSQIQELKKGNKI